MAKLNLITAGNYISKNFILKIHKNLCFTKLLKESYHFVFSENSGCGDYMKNKLIKTMRIAFKSP